jgi:Fur family transcriptional regulator, zinc uptake regulator
MRRTPSKRRSSTARNKSVIEALRNVARPLSAYQLIDHLRGDGIWAPATVYRALNHLIADGRVHRLESLNAFVACRHQHHDALAVFAICEVCGCVTEFSEQHVVDRLIAWAKSTNFAVRGLILEIRGRCASCDQAAGAKKKQPRRRSSVLEE